MNNTATPFSHPVYIMAKPAGASCNLRCGYCYYIDKERHGRQEVMSDALLEEFVRQYIGMQTTPEVLFTWHGGEPLLRGLDFYEKVMRLQRQYAGGRQVDNCLQTNGTLITDDMARFFHDNGWLVGVSIDGPQHFHDAYRLSADGHPSFDRVMAGIETLQRHDVEWNAMAVVTKASVKHPLEFYRFFKDMGCRYLQFEPIVESRCPGTLTPYSIAPEEWGRFLCALFDEWVRHDVGETFVQLFDATLANWCGVAPGICSLARQCGHAGVITHDGDVYSCDHFVFPRHRLGNIMQTPLATMMMSQRQTAFGTAKHNTLPNQCRRCPWLFTCWGECPKNRFVSSTDGEPGLNYLCEGYRMFFSHAAPFMDYMKERIEAGGEAADIMRNL